MLKFTEKDHKYESTDGSNIDWVSVTTLISNFKTPFNGLEQATKVSKKKSSKWYGIPPKEILEIWDRIGKEATTLGTWYHGEREKLLCELDTLEKEGITLPVIRPIFENDVKLAPSQKIENGIYPEHFVYLKSAGVCGQSDIVEVVNDTLYITDFKTNSEIKTEPYRNWEGIAQMMTGPVSHLEDHHLNHYALQLSLYMFIIIKHNPHLKPGSLTINHILFEEVGKDQYGYAIKARDEHGNPIVKDVIQYDLPYLRSDVINIIQWLKDNRNKLKPKN